MIKYFCDRCEQEAPKEHLETVMLYALCSDCRQAFQSWMNAGRSSRQEVLRQAVNHLLKEGAHHPDRFGDDAVNWGAVHCVEARQFTDGTWQVTVVEASPEASHLRAWLRDALADEGDDVEVVTEW